MSEPEDKLDIGALRDRFLECPVCIEHFNLTDRRPRLLHACLHAFCTQCLDQLLEKDGKGQVTCPVCRHVEKVRGNAESLHIDPVREQLVEYLQITHKKEIVCDDCPDKNQATSRCVECGDNLCNDCALAHKRNKLTRSHQTATLGELVSETTRKLKIRYYCSAHPERAIECYCENCEKLCCLMCAVTSHKGHDINDLIDTSKIKMTKIESHLDEMDKLSEKLILAKQQCETYAKKLVKERDCSRANIIEEFDKLENLLKKHKMAMLLKVEEETENLVSVARKQGSQYEDSLAEIESVKTYFDNAKTRTDEVSFLQTFPSMMKTLQNIATSNDRKIEVSSKRVEFKASSINNVQDSINAFGSVTVLDIENEETEPKNSQLPGPFNVPQQQSWSKEQEYSPMSVHFPRYKSPSASFEFAPISVTKDSTRKYPERKKSSKQKEQKSNQIDGAFVPLDMPWDLDPIEQKEQKSNQIDGAFVPRHMPWDWDPIEQKEQKSNQMAGTYVPDQLPPGGVPKRKTKKLDLRIGCISAAEEGREPKCLQVPGPEEKKDYKGYIQQPKKKK